ncbi:MAG TPA: hypothetical protein DD979_03995 [Gammaproteobacteria bacterium]|jgi:molybdopterin/thiamine biosynthesis adenylyltransferase|nr:hypothetical protein [Gammaproteobacteria bacterium]
MAEVHENTPYMVLFIGEVRHGICAATLKRTMATTFNVSLLRIEKLFTGRPEIIKNNLSQAVALRYCDALKTMGAVSWVEPMPPFYRKYVDRRKNVRTRRSRNGTRERRGGMRGQLSSDRRARQGRRYHDR